MRGIRLSASLVILGIGLTVFYCLGGRNPALSAEQPDAEMAALQRTRAQVKMLDDLYKNFIVHITATYVSAEETVPAAKVAMKVFQAMHKKGWHKARLVDATGQPVRASNLPRTPFEKAAVAKLKSGLTYHEELGSENGVKVLRAATVVPVVMRQCTTCHQGKKEGELIGAIVYEVPIK